MSAWQIPQAEDTALIGPSGCGKTTFLRAFNRMNDFFPGPAQSEVLHGQNITRPG